MKYLNFLSLLFRPGTTIFCPILISLFGFTEADAQDNLPVPIRQHTASSHVHMIDSAFYIPQLERSTTIWIYLPEGYDAKKKRKRYPVIYMHDGENVFDNFTSADGEWGIDECLDTLIANGKPPAIIVAIASGQERMKEYSPYSSEETGEGKGDRYIEFLISTLKPYIDKHYRTLASKENTIIAGSSMGGLISCYALLIHPEIFGKAGIFSPVFPADLKINSLIDSTADNIKGKIFFYMGGMDNDTTVRNTRAIANKLGKKSEAIIYTISDPKGGHNEVAWRKWFAEFYVWIITEGYDSPIKIDK